MKAVGRSRSRHLEKDVFNGSYVLQYFAITAPWAGDKELALQQLEGGLRVPQASEMLELRRLKAVPGLGSAPRRSALRANRQFACPKVVCSLQLSTDSLVMAEPALPHEARPHPSQQEPASLDGQRLHKIRPL